MESPDELKKIKRRRRKSSPTTLDGQLELAAASFKKELPDKRNETQKASGISASKLEEERQVLNAFLAGLVPFLLLLVLLLLWRCFAAAAKSRRRKQRGATSAGRQRGDELAASEQVATDSAGGERIVLIDRRKDGAAAGGERLESASEVEIIRRAEGGQQVDVVTEKQNSIVSLISRGSFLAAAGGAARPKVKLLRKKASQSIESEQPHEDEASQLNKPVGAAAAAADCQPPRSRSQIDQLPAAGAPTCQCCSSISPRPVCNNLLAEQNELSHCSPQSWHTFCAAAANSSPACANRGDCGHLPAESRAKRHYEYYYDDEHEDDAYRQFSATIGLQLGYEQKLLQFCAADSARCDHLHCQSGCRGTGRPASCACCAPSQPRPCAQHFVASEVAARAQSTCACNLCPVAAATQLVPPAAQTCAPQQAAGAFVARPNTATPTPPSRVVGLAVEVEQKRTTGRIELEPTPSGDTSQADNSRQFEGNSATAACCRPETQPQTPRHLAAFGRQSSASGCSSPNALRQFKWRRRHVQGSAGHLSCLPRRMSIAGERPSGGDGLLSGRAESLRREVERLPLPAQRVIPRHRASIAGSGASGLWQLQLQRANQQAAAAAAAAARQAKSRSPAERQSSASPNSAAFAAHRPSATSLFDAAGNCCASGASSSQYSSSVGSSSGIGFSGSQCTNTPTASAFPYASFATGTTCGRHEEQESLGGYNWPAAQQVNFHCAEQFRQAAAAAAAAANGCNKACLGQFGGLTGVGQHTLANCLHPFAAEGCAARGGVVAANEAASFGACCVAAQKRKYSLPAQLESQATLLGRADGNQSTRRTTLLFESTQLQHARQLPCGDKTSRGHLDSRRDSSQLVARQSSFWLDDNDNNNYNNTDSVLSLTTSAFEQQFSCDEEPCRRLSSCSQPEAAGEQQVVAPVAAAFAEQEADEELAAACQRASLSSQAYSVESIVSVRPNLDANEQRRPHDQNSFPVFACGGELAVESSNSSQVCSPTSQHSSRDRDDRRLLDLPAGSRSQAPGVRSSAARSRALSRSTSSSTSSPSPDLSKPSERILGLAAKSSSSISKRRLFGKLRTRRRAQTNPTAATRDEQANEGALPQAGRNEADCDHDEDEDKFESYDNKGNELRQRNLLKLIEQTNKSSEQESDSAASVTIDKDFTELLPTARPVSDLNSASLERQCRDLWKLRATLQDDSCDNWTNYHQRLARRHDSGYKSIDNQFNSSLEQQNNSIEQQVASANRLATETNDEQQQNSSRPPSGCSKHDDSGNKKH